MDEFQINKPLQLNSVEQIDIVDEQVLVIGGDQILKKVDRSSLGVLQTLQQTIDTGGNWISSSGNEKANFTDGIGLELDGVTTSRSGLRLKQIKNGVAGNLIILGSYPLQPGSQSDLGYVKNSSGDLYYPNASGVTRLIYSASTFTDHTSFPVDSDFAVQSVAIDDNDNVYSLHFNFITTTYRIYKIDHDLQTQTLVGTLGGGLTSRSSIVIDPTNTSVLIANSSASIVQMDIATGVVSNWVYLGFNNEYGRLIRYGSDIYMAYQTKIWKIDSSFNVSEFWSKSAFININSFFLNREYLYIQTTSTGPKLHKISLEDASSEVISNILNLDKTVVVNSKGDTLICDNDHQRIYRKLNGDTLFELYNDFESIENSGAELYLDEFDNIFCICTNKLAKIPVTPNHLLTTDDRGNLILNPELITLESITGIAKTEASEAVWSNVVNDPTTSAKSSADLDANYPGVEKGFKVHCIAIVGGGLIYEKTYNGWCQYEVTITT